jgi:hypothetical protein
MAELGGILFLAFFTERFIDYMFDTQKGDSRPWLRYVSLFVGVLLAVVYQADLVAQIGFDNITPLHPVINYIVTGVVISGGANYLSDFAGKFLR